MTAVKEPNRLETIAAIGSPFFDLGSMTDKGDTLTNEKFSHKLHNPVAHLDHCLPGKVETELFLGSGNSRHMSVFRSKMI